MPAIELSDSVEPLPPVPPSPPPTLPGEVNAVDAAQAAADDALIRAAGGIQEDRFFFALGTRITEAGVEATNGMRREVEARPFAHDAIDQLLETVKLENRENFEPFPLDALFVDEAGELLRVHAGLAGRPTELAWTHIGERLGIRGLPGFLPYCPPAIRADVVEHALAATMEAHAQRVTEAVAADRKPPPTPRFTLARRKGMGGKAFNVPQVFRVGGPKYLDLGPEVVLPKLRELIPPSMHATVTYDGAAYAVDMVAASPVQVTGHVGETFRAGLRLYGNDVKRGRLKVSGYLDRTRCLNGTVVPTSLLGCELMHAGNQDKVLIQLQETLTNLDSVVRVFVDRWALMKAEAIIDDDHYTPERVIGALLDARIVVIPGKREDVMGKLVAAWQREPAHDVTSVINCLTRAAQTEWWHDVETMNDIETQAGELLFVRNLTARVHAIIDHET